MSVKTAGLRVDTIVGTFAPDVASPLYYCYYYDVDYSNYYKYPRTVNIHLYYKFPRATTHKKTLLNRTSLGIHSDSDTIH